MQNLAQLKYRLKSAHVVVYTMFTRFFTLMFAECADGTVFWRLLVPKSLSKVYIRHLRVHTLRLSFNSKPGFVNTAQHHIGVLFLSLPCLPDEIIPRMKADFVIVQGLTVAIMTLLHLVQPVLQQRTNASDKKTLSSVIWKTEYYKVLGKRRKNNNSDPRRLRSLSNAQRFTRNNNKSEA